jgi:FkbM family methyltransferase
LISNLALILRHLGPLGLLKAIYFVVLTGIARTIGVKTMKKRVFDYSLYLDTSDKGLSRTLFLFGRREIDHYKMLQEILKPGMQILDIGANIGYYAVMESLVVGSEGKITAIEPMLPNIEMLRRNVALNNATNINVIHGAVSESTGTGKMFMSTHSNLHTFHRDGSAFDYLESIPVDVPIMTLRDAGEQSGSRPELIRMDVEGHEVEILGQLIDLVREDVMTPRVIFETHLSRYKAENDFAPVLNGLFELGYRVSVAASSSKTGTARLRALGYEGGTPFYSDFGERALFRNISNEHAVDLICNTGGLRTVLLGEIG